MSAAKTPFVTCSSAGASTTSRANTTRPRACLKEVLRENVHRVRRRRLRRIQEASSILLGKLSEAEEHVPAGARHQPRPTRKPALNLAVTASDLREVAKEAKEVCQRALMASKSAPRSLDPFAKGKIANMHADTGAAYHAVGMYPDAVRE